MPGLGRAFFSAEANVFEVWAPVRKTTVATRFAPTPNGLLHFGSLVAAVASYLFARSQNGLWHLRFDDLDTLRVRKEWADGILFQLEAFGFEWDGPVVRQSEHVDEYRSWLREAEQADMLLKCSCSRRELEQKLARRNAWGETVHPPRCTRSPDRESFSLRWILHRSNGPEPVHLEFMDGVQGLCRVDDAWSDIGPFVVQRADGLIAYHLANALDDTRMGITHSVRGADLIPSAFRQIALHRQALGRASLVPVLPEFAHVPLVTDSGGVKLGKSRLSPKIEPVQARLQLLQALACLGQNLGERETPESNERPSALLSAAADRFSLQSIPSRLSVPVPDR